MLLSWTIEGETQLSRRLRIISSSIKDWTPAFEDTADALVKVFSVDAFDTEGQAFDEPWAALKPRYAARKAREGYGDKPILVKTGKMQKAFQSLAKTDYAQVWNSTAYFKYHQSNQPRSKLPRRVMMKLAEDQRQMVVKIFHTYWHNKMKKA